MLAKTAILRSARLSSVVSPSITVVSQSAAEKHDNTAVVISLSGTASGDVVYVASASHPLAAPPSGYTEISLGSTTRMVVYRKVLSAADSSVTVSANGDSTAGNACLAIVLRGVSNTTPEDTTPTESFISGSSVDGPSIVTVTANALVLSFGMAFVNDTSVTCPSGYINQSNINSNGSVSPTTLGMATKTISSPGTEDPGAWSGFGTDTVTGYALTVAVRPA